MLSVPTEPTMPDLHHHGPSPRIISGTRTTDRCDLPGSFFPDGADVTPIHLQLNVILFHTVHIWSPIPYRVSTRWLYRFVRPHLRSCHKSMGLWPKASVHLSWERFSRAEKRPVKGSLFQPTVNLSNCQKRSGRTGEWWRKSTVGCSLVRREAQPQVIVGDSAGLPGCCAFLSFCWGSRCT